jgi:hypothetical protein
MLFERLPYRRHLDSFLRAAAMHDRRVLLEIGAAPFLAGDVKARHGEDLNLFLRQGAHFLLSHVLVRDERPVVLGQIEGFGKKGRFFEGAKGPFSRFF